MNYLTFFLTSLKALQQQLLCVMTAVWKVVGKINAFAIQIFLKKKLMNFVLEFGSKFSFGYKPQKQTNQISPKNPQRNNKRKKIKLLLVSDNGKVFNKSPAKTSILQFHERMHGQSVTD